MPQTKVLRFNWYDGAGSLPSQTSYCFAWDSSGASINPIVPISTTGTYYANYIYKKANGTKGVGWKMLVNENEYSVIANTKVKNFAKSVNWNNYPISSYMTGVQDEAALEQFQQENGKLIRVNDKVYRILVSKTTSNGSIIQRIAQTSTLGFKMNELADILK